MGSEGEVRGRSDRSERGATPEVSDTGSARMHVYFRGRVQGVGFRYTARAFAHRYGVSGFVRNLADGRVELEVEGPRETLIAYLGELEREFRHSIQGQEARWLPATGSYQGFSVRF